MNSGHWQKILMISMLAVLSVIFCNAASAFPTYDGCAECHGGFRTNNYISLHDGSAWGQSLMDGHKTFLSNNCDACHSGSSRSPVFPNSSSDTSLKKSCVGCHGRDEDVTGSCTGLSLALGGIEVECGSGEGLRQYHASNVPTSDCGGCHSAGPAPFGENIAPYNYGRVSVVMKNSCDDDGTESQFGATGLDNDGDGQRDGDDSDCQPNTAPTQPGTLSASAVTTNSATVSWAASTDTDGDSITYQVDYRLNGDASWTSGGSTTGTSQPLSGLDADQSYDVRVTPNDGTEDGTSRTALNLFKTDIDPDVIFEDSFEGN